MNDLSLMPLPFSALRWLAAANPTKDVVGQHLDQAKQIQTHMKTSTSASR
jgi:hypothetical protein